MSLALSRWVMRYRGAVALFFLATTVFFAVALPRVQVRTIFRDLLPTDDPFVQTYLDNPTFGNPMAVSIMVKSRSGSIYNAATLAKIWQMTRELDLAPSINHDTLISIATQKVRYAEATHDGVELQAVMGDFVPRTDEEIREFRRRVLKSPNARAFFISIDESSALIKADFLDTLDYGQTFAFLQSLVENARDADHEIYMAGQPALTGWVYRLQHQTYRIFGVTVAALLLALVLYMRNVAGVVAPVVSAAMAGVWGFGLVGWLARPIEPLLMIVPLLLVARSFSHCVQYTERYYEILLREGDRRRAAELTMAVMMAPSVLGILTDVFGIVFIAITPIRTMVNHAIFCGFWALWIIPTGVFLMSVLLSWLPVPRNLQAIAGGRTSESGIHRLEARALGFVARIVEPRVAPVALVVTLLLGGLAVAANAKLKIGNPVEGSNFLWQSSEYNTAVRAINRHFPGVATLEIILESKHRDPQRRVARTPEAVQVSAELQRLLESDRVMPPRATLSFNDYLQEINRLMSGGNPKWQLLDPSDQEVAHAGFVATFGTSPYNYAAVADFEFRTSSVSSWFADNKQETVDGALANARHAISVVGEDHPEFRVRLGSGLIALQQSMNNVVKHYHWYIVGLVNVAILLIAAVAYRSLAAGLILLVPVNLSNFMQGAAMYVLGIGLDINATIVAVMGIGIGIDYGIYLLSRIQEEYALASGDLAQAIHAALTTTGKAILFTASIMLAGILPWHFLSGLKFMADMGTLLVSIMLINMVLSLAVLPLVVWMVDPAFLRRRPIAGAARSYRDERVSSFL